MTDYLEPVTESGSDALWEAERRLAAALAGLIGQDSRLGEGVEEKTEQPAQIVVMDGLFQQNAAEKLERSMRSVMTNGLFQEREEGKTEQPEQSVVMDELLWEGDRPALDEGQKAAWKETGIEETQEDFVQLPLSAAVKLLDGAADRGLKVLAGNEMWRRSGLYAGGGENWARRNTGGKTIPGADSLYILRGDSPALSGGETLEQRAFDRPEFGRPTDMQETVQAERLDQLFRRDSRRYDGGFFLY